MEKPFGSGGKICVKFYLLMKRIEKQLSNVKFTHGKKNSISEEHVKN